MEKNRDVIEELGNINEMEEELKWHEEYERKCQEWAERCKEEKRKVVETVYIRNLALEFRGDGSVTWKENSDYSLYKKGLVVQADRDGEGARR